MKRKLTIISCWAVSLITTAQTHIAGVLPSYNEESRGTERTQQYFPVDNAFVCLNGNNRFTRALYGSHSDWRLETSDRPVFAVVKKGHHRHVAFTMKNVPLDQTNNCRASYHDGMREYELQDSRWNGNRLKVTAMALPNEEGAIWRFDTEEFTSAPQIEVSICEIAIPKLKRNGDIGADKPGVFEADPQLKGLEKSKAIMSDDGFSQYVVLRLDKADDNISWQQADSVFYDAINYYEELSNRIQFETPDPYINALAGPLVLAADGDWDGQTWLHGCIGWRMPLAGWRAAYAGDVLGWNDRAKTHFDAYAKSQVTNVEPTIPHPSQDQKMNIARAEKRWGTQMYSNGYICRNPERNDQMHHYDMNLNYIDELLWHFQYDADTVYMKKMWPVLESHLEWEKRNYDPDGDHLYDAYCCIWASDALYYSGGAVTHSTAYNYRGNKLAARIAKIIGKNAEPYQREADAILEAMNSRLWMKEKGVWAEFEDGMGLRRLHESPAVWSIYTPIDCGAWSGRQAWQATDWVTRNIPHIPVTSQENAPTTIATSNWLPYSWSINNVANAEVWHTALAYFEAGRAQEGYNLMKANILDNMYYGQSPANFGQLSHHDAARGECYRDFGDCIGIASRTLLQGLFGVIPQALYGYCFIQPGFPASWDNVTLKTPYIEYRYTRANGKERYEITQNFAQPLTIVIRRTKADGTMDVTIGTNEKYQVIEVNRETSSTTDAYDLTYSQSQNHYGMKKATEADVAKLGLAEPELRKPFRKVDMKTSFNSNVDDIFKNEYTSPRPQTTTLQIPIQGIGEWCHPQYTPAINDSVFRQLAKRDEFKVAGVPFMTPQNGKNIAYTSLWDNYPDSVSIPLKGNATSAYLLLAGSTNHMQSRIDNGIVVVRYEGGTCDTLHLHNPDNWCPIEQDYFVDGKAFCTTEPRPYRICLGTGAVSRDLGKTLDIKGVYGREIPGGAAQMLRMPLNQRKKLESITLRTLSNDVVIGLMGVTLQ